MIGRLRFLVLAPVMLVAVNAEAASNAAPAGVQQGSDLGPYRSIIQRGFGVDSSDLTGTATAPAPSPYRLIGTIEGGERSGVVIDDGAGVQTFYRVGQSLPDGSRIVNVRRDRVLLKRSDGTISELVVTEDALAPAQPSSSAGGPSVAPAADAPAPDDRKMPERRPRRQKRSAPDE